MEQARATLADARRAIDDLRTHDVSLDDVAHAVQKEINRFTIATGIVCTVDLDGLIQAPASHSEHILRAITEGLANVARHAQARQVRVQAMMSKHDLEIEIRDDGIGFEPATVSKSIGHYGLLGLRERARLIGGSLEITSSPGCGTTLKLRLPEKPEEGTS